MSWLSELSSAVGSLFPGYDIPSGGLPGIPGIPTSPLPNGTMPVPLPSNSGYANDFPHASSATGSGTGTTGTGTGTTGTGTGTTGTTGTGTPVTGTSPQGGLLGWLDQVAITYLNNKSQAVSEPQWEHVLILVALGLLMILLLLSLVDSNSGGGGDTRIVPIPA